MVGQYSSDAVLLRKEEAHTYPILAPQDANVSGVLCKHLHYDTFIRYERKKKKKKPGLGSGLNPGPLVRGPQILPLQHFGGSHNLLVTPFCVKSPFQIAVARRHGLLMAHFDNLLRLIDIEKERLLILS